MPPDDKKTNAADALTAQDIRNAVNTFTSAPVYKSYVFANLFGSPFITRHASDPVVPEKAPTPASESQDPIVGYRVWNLNPDGLLVSSVKKEVWPARKRMSLGTKEDDLHLGIHAAKSIDRITKPPVYESLEEDLLMYGGLFGEEQGLWDEYRGQVAGEVSLWGEVKEFKHGYTGEFAYPRRLWVSETLDVLQIMRLEQNYGVPVETRANLGPWKESSFSVAMRSMFLPTPFFTVTAAPTHFDPLAVTNSGKFDEKGKP